MQNLLTIRDRRGERVVDKSDRPLADLLPAVQETPGAAEVNEPTTTTTDHAPARRSVRLGVSAAQLRAAAIVGSGIGLAIALVVLLGTWTPARPRPVPAVVPTVPAAAPTAAPVPTVVLAPPPPLAAFWAPGGERAPDIAASTAFTPTARYGSTWVAITLPGGGSVWIGRADAEARGPLPDALPDLAPPTPAPPPPAPAVVPAAPPPAATCYESTIAVSSAAGVPLGTVTGSSCISQAAANQNAEQLAAEMRGRP